MDTGALTGPPTRMGGQLFRIRWWAGVQFIIVSVLASQCFIVPESLWLGDSFVPRRPKFRAKQAQDSGWRLLCRMSLETAYPTVFSLEGDEIV